MFSYNGEIARVHYAVADANALIRTNSFLARICSEDHFDMSDATGREIATLIEMFVIGNFGDLKVVTYKSKNPWSSAYGYFNPSKPDHIYLNTRKIDRSNASICASLIHEMVHFLDSRTPLEFGHGSNSPVGKENTAPYWIDNLAEETLLFTYKQSSFAHKIVTPWYYKIFNFLKWW